MELVNLGRYITGVETLTSMVGVGCMIAVGILIMCLIGDYHRTPFVLMIVCTLVSIGSVFVLVKLEPTIQYTYVVNDLEELEVKLGDYEILEQNGKIYELLKK